MKLIRFSYPGGFRPEGTNNPTILPAEALVQMGILEESGVFQQPYNHFIQPVLRSKRFADLKETKQ